MSRDVLERARTIGSGARRRRSPARTQTTSATVAQKARTYGFAGVQADGVDPLATSVVTKAAREKALEAGGDRVRPTLLEAVQYRYGAHTTADDPSELFEHTHAEQIPRLEDLQDSLADLRERHGDEALLEDE